MELVLLACIFRDFPNGFHPKDNHGYFQKKSEETRGIVRSRSRPRERFFPGSTTPAKNGDSRMEMATRRWRHGDDKTKPVFPGGFKIQIFHRKQIFSYETGSRHDIDIRTCTMPGNLQAIFVPWFSAGKKSAAESRCRHCTAVAESVTH